MSGVMERTLGILELLSQHGEGLELAAIADQLNMPRSAAHRLLNDLVRCGYVRQLRDHGDYMLTTKLVSIGLSFLSHSGIVDFSQPLLDRLAEVSGELVRLGVVDGERLTWVARAQGARQGIGQPEEYGPNAPRTLDEMMAMVRGARERGYSVTVETFTAGLNAMAAPVRLGNRRPIGVITIAGPTVRFTEARMHALAPELLALCDQMAAASGTSPFFQGAHSGNGGPKSGRLPIYAA